MDKDSMTHTQFPLIPGYGITAHKAQGNIFNISNLMCILFTDDVYHLVLMVVPLVRCWSILIIDY